MPQSNVPHSLRKNPSRETCENMIRRILMTEVLQEGKNQHFKQASDFMSYFESLYPASESLTKQVQRAVKAMELPKDTQGYFIINKTTEQIRQDDDIKYALSLSNASTTILTDATPVFLSLEPALCPYVKQLLLTSFTFQDKILTITESSNGLLIYSSQPEQLEKLLQSFLVV